MNNRDKRVLVGMSGGIDSSATCIMLQEQGYELVGVTMRTWDVPSRFSTPGQDVYKRQAHNKYAKEAYNNFSCDTINMVNNTPSVSYTHLDVYKRQIPSRSAKAFASSTSSGSS